MLTNAAITCSFHDNFSPAATSFQVGDDGERKTWEDSRSLFQADIIRIPHAICFAISDLDISSTSAISPQPLRRQVVLNVNLPVFSHSYPTHILSRCVMALNL